MIIFIYSQCLNNWCWVDYTADFKIYKLHFNHLNLEYSINSFEIYFLIWWYQWRSTKKEQLVGRKIFKYDPFLHSFLVISQSKIITIKFLNIIEYNWWIKIQIK